MWSAAPWSGSAPPQANLSSPGGSIPPGSSLFRGHGQTFPRFLFGRATGGTWLAGVTFPMMTFLGIIIRWVLRFLRQIGTWEEPGWHPPYVVASTMELGSWGPSTHPMSMWTHIQCPWMSLLPWIFTVPNWGMVTLCAVWICPWTFSRCNSLDAVGSGTAEGVVTFVGPHPPCTFIGQLEQPRNNHTKVGLPSGCGCVG